MAAALQHLPPDNLPFTLDSYPRRLTVTDLDFQDTRYPTLSSSSKHKQVASYSAGSQDPPQQETSRASWVDYAPSMSRASGYNESQMQFHDAGEHQQDSRRHESPGGSPYLHHDGLEGRLQRIPSNTNAPSQELLRASFDTGSPLLTPDMGQRASGMDQHRDQQQYAPPSPRHPALPAAGIGAGPSSSVPSPIIPASAGPSYTAAAMAIPISPNPRAYAQQPTYITPTSAPSPINPMYTPPQVRQEEICVECAMRDQDMADVDVTSPGIWERESDAAYEDLLRRELDDESMGIVAPESSIRPRARGGRLTEENLKLWLSVNPKEPSSRQQTLDQYVKSQRALLEAEAMAHARAMRESRMLDDKMRDAYSQLRRSAYELGNSAQPSDDSGGVRIKAPRSVSSPIAAVPSQHREVTLLENGMIVEHVDVRKEEREERERRKREEKRDRSRARKSSRSSRAGDVMSVYSLQTPLPTDSGFFSGTRNESRLSQSVSARPSSVMTGGGDRPSTLLRAQSQASFDMQSIGSGTSPRRSRFFGLHNLSSGWRSQDSLAPSGSMIDMHVALQREQQYLAQVQNNPDVLDIGSNAHTLRGGEPWPRTETKPDDGEARSEKKLKGLKKFWKLVTGTGTKHAPSVSSRPHTRSLDRTEDDMPLAPPPPLSYLVDQGSRRHGSTPSLPLALAQGSQNPNTLSPFTASPPTAPSSLQPSPTSSRRSTGDREGSDGRKHSDSHVPDPEDPSPQPDTSFQDLEPRGRTTHSSWTLSTSGPATPPLSASPPVLRPMSTVIRRDKSLPPLPGESNIEFPNHSMPDARPQTVFTYDPRTISGELLPPQAPFRTNGARRQSFGGIGSNPKSFTLPAKGGMTRGQVNVPPFLAEERYGEFGSPRNSLGQWAAGQFSQPSLQVPSEKPKKRKSKFGLSALFSRKSMAVDDAPDPLDMSALRISQAEAPYDPTVMNGATSGYASPMSANSHAPRMSIASKKNLAEVIDQDSEFIAYRYPSNDQRLDLMR